MSKKKVLGALAVGTAIGVGTGILFAPKKGSETRKDIKNKTDKLIDKAKNINKKKIKQDEKI